MGISGNKILGKLELPAWTFIPIKILFLLGFLIPIALWIGNIKSNLSMGNETEADNDAISSGHDYTPPPTLVSKLVSASDTQTAVNKEKVNGIDVSHYQGTIKWEQVKKNNNIHFAFAKATGGASFVDPEFENTNAVSRNSH